MAQRMKERAVFAIGLGHGRAHSPGARSRRSANAHAVARDGQAPVAVAGDDDQLVAGGAQPARGGKAQLQQAVDVLNELGIEGVPIVGVAKGEARRAGDETLIVAGSGRTLFPGPASPASHLVQAVRDEAHRFAITYHRDVRGKRALRSELDDIGGIGPARKKALLKRFGSVRRIREASVEDVAATPGIPRELAERLKRHLAREGMLA